ncbi:hypothetical protein JF535_01160 [Microbulbifer salipaludis]|uniref:Uncharacterized protein n=1 Tax=Microbulbifer salipaludis TaxID=187980 RepID=A0ABS3E2E2_9GAMM|nr:hypothetical protein [Microbulbifer salipaludis]MBN8429447.1 hypothetical protein [Microbulbifer salipaludis]
MLNKSQSISARLSAQDYTYLMSIDRNGAVTQSEKVRELIAMARESLGSDSFVRTYLAASETMLPIRAKYIEDEQRSLLVEALFDLVTEGAAAIQACADDESFASTLEDVSLPAITAFLEKISLVSLQEEPRLANPQTSEKIRRSLRQLVKS